LKAFTIAIGFVFGKDSILATKLWDFVVNVNRKHSIIYKNRIAIDNTFAAKVLWSVDCFTQLFLEDCRKCHDREDVNQRVINFDGLNMDIILHRFHAILPPLFHKLNNKSDEKNNSKFGARNGGKGKRKGGSNGNKEEQRNSQKKMSKKITNANQVKEFKMAEGETWEGTFQGKCPESRVKWMGLFVCPRFHTKGECWDVGCKYSKTHLPASAVPNNVKKEYLDYMGCCRKKSSNSE
jgi:hypothetical protein